MPEIKQWRPEGWKDCPQCKNQGNELLPCSCQEQGCETWCAYYTSYEAGATAMYEALLKELPEIVNHWLRESCYPDLPLREMQPREDIDQFARSYLEEKHV